MKSRLFYWLAAYCLLGFGLQAALPPTVKPVKNLILMIPDGTSVSAISLARWYQRYQDPSKLHLAIDPYVCGTVVTYSSNAPIGDSAPTTSCYMTGIPSITGFVSTYPYSDGANDLFQLDPSRQYTPLATILEGAKILQKRKTGLVFSCEFPHATPADCSAHSYSRKRYDWISEQMVDQNLDVVIGGGVSLLSAEQQQRLKRRGYGLFLDDRASMLSYTGDRMWALFGDRDMEYDLDRDTLSQPSLAEMTRKAIDMLRPSQDGFFLMVEGSKVDWAAHANDPVGIVTEFLAFDRACAEALRFAQEDGETAVIIVPDHGNSGISIGRYDIAGYDKRNKDELFAQLSRYQLTADGMAKLLNKTPNSEVQALFEKYCGYKLSDEELDQLNRCGDYKQSPISAEKRRRGAEGTLYSGQLGSFVSSLYKDHSSVGFTSHGHTGEEVLLAVYHPQMNQSLGVLMNYELHEYMCRLLELEGKLPKLTEEAFAPHDEVFKGMEFKILAAGAKKESPKLLVKHKGKELLVLPFGNRVLLDGKELELNSVTVYVDKNERFYLNRSLRNLLDQ